MMSVTAQKYSTKTGSLKFEASVPSFEEVEADNKTASAVLDTSNGNLAVLALVKGFRFKVALMEEHFNENYVESDKFPKASFTGKIENFDASKLTSQATTYTITGDLTLHGVTKKVSSKAKISKSGTTIQIMGDFIAKPEDYNISIPKTVRSKVANQVNVSYNLSLNSSK
jgi:polyisoprenoid-binding protein YceI